MVKPSDSEIIRIYAAFAHVLSLSGIINYFDEVEWSAKQLEDSLLMAHQIQDYFLQVS